MMRRPLLYGAAAISAEITAFYLWGREAGFAAAVISVSAAFLMSKSKAARGLFIAALFCWLGFASCFFHEIRVPSVESMEGERALIQGRILQSEIKETSGGDEYLQLKMSAEAVNGDREAAGGRILVRYYGDLKGRPEETGGVPRELIPGREISVEGVLEKPSGKRNPKCFDYSLYLRSLGIGSLMTGEAFYFTDNEKTDFPGRLYGELFKIKEGFLEKVEKAEGEKTEGFIRGIMFGEKTGIEENTLEEFQQNGTAHILSVSGLHIGIIYGVLRRLWKGKKGKAFFLFAICFFFCYSAMSGFSPSVVRAAVMVSLHALASVSAKRYDLSSAAFFVLTVMLVKNPFQMFNAGFQMSFLAVLTLSLMMPFIKRVYGGIFAASLAVQAGIAPYIAYNFNYFSLAAVFVNVPVIFLTGIIVPLSMFMAAAERVWEPLFEISAATVSGLCRMLDEINAFTAAEGLTVFNVTSPPESLLGAYYLGLLFFASEEGRLMIMRRKKKILALFIAVTAAASMAFGSAMKSGFEEASLIFVDVGQGDCIHFKTAEGESYLIDGGGKEGYNTGRETLRDYLLKNGVKKVEGAFVTHLHTDHYKGIAELCREGMVERLYLYEGSRVSEKKIAEETAMPRENILYLAGGDVVDMGQGESVEVLWPERKNEAEYKRLSADEEDENSSSLVFKVSLRGVSFTATGDIEEECQNQLARMWREDLKADVLKASHHGSRYSYSSEFTELTAPVYGVFQVGKNGYGHPDKGVIEKYEEMGIIVYRNDRDGAVGFTPLEGGGLRVSTASEKGT